MRTAGHGSWSFAIDVPTLSHVALFVRDACGLQVAHSATIPPPLSQDVPDRSPLLSSAAREAAGAEWPSLWDAIEVCEGAALLEASPVQGYAIRQARPVSCQKRLLDWPNLEPLSERPALRDAFQLTYNEGTEWFAQRRRSIVGNGNDAARNLVGYGMVGAIAEAVVAEHAAPSEPVCCSMLVLDVKGNWFQFPIPGVLACSEEIVRDKGALRPLLEEAFRTGIDGERERRRGKARGSRQLPASILEHPVVLEPSQGSTLVVRRVIPYSDGFEIELRRPDGWPPRRGAMASASLGPYGPNPWGGDDLFLGLEIEVRFPDGRGPGLYGRPLGDGGDGDVVITRFWRAESTPDCLWLWVMPPPPDGDVVLVARWPEYGVAAATARFEGRLLRPGNAR